MNFKTNPVYESMLERLGRLNLCDPEDLCYMLAYFMRRDAFQVASENDRSKEKIIRLLERAAENLDQAGLDYYVSTK